MCRLFAVSADCPVYIEYPVLEGPKPFISLAVQKHQDGWGVSYVDESPTGEETLQTVKAPRPAYHDETFSSLIKGLITRLIIVHLREAKRGDKTYENTHPFEAGGWVFAHNGTIENFHELEKELPGMKFEGETDSERYFYLILKKIRETGDVVEGISAALDWIRKKNLSGARNFLMSDGRFVYAYRFGRDLFYSTREAGTHKEFTRSADGGQLVSKPVKLVLVASEILTDDDWIEIPEEGLVIIDTEQNVTVKQLSEDISAGAALSAAYRQCMCS